MPGSAPILLYTVSYEEVHTKYRRNYVTTIAGLRPNVRGRLEAREAA
jgi:hypothetical protein